MDATSSPGARRPARALDLERVRFDALGDGTLWAHGATYKASADGQRFTYIPFFGSSAPRNYPIVFELESVRVGARALDLARTASVLRQHDSLAFDRGALVERYELRLESVEQTFVLEALPAREALTLRMAVRGELEASPGSAGLEFRGEPGFVRFGHATVFDAAGHNEAIETTWSDGAIEMRVSAEFLARARFPVTIDPLITTFAVDSSAEDDSSPDIAYEESTGKYLVCWERVFSATDHDVWAQEQDGAGALVAGTTAAIDFTSTSWTHPRVASNPLASQFLVVAAVGDPASGARTIWGREREAEAPFVQSVPFPISGAGTSGDQRDPDVGGDPVLVGPTYYCVVWTSTFNATDRDVHARLVQTNATLLGTSTIFVDNSGATLDVDPSVSKSNGPTPFALQNWNLAWTRSVFGANGTLHAAQVRWDGVLVTPSFQITAAGAVARHASASPGADSGGARRFLVAYERDLGSDTDIAFAVLDGSTTLESNSLTALENLPALLHQNQVEPAAETDGSCFAIAYSEPCPLSGNSNIWLSSLSFNGTSALVEGHVSLGASPAHEGSPQLTSRRSGNGVTSRQFGATWRVGAPSSAGDIAGAIFECQITPPLVHSFCDGDGCSTGVDCPCGNNGAPGNGCANSQFAAGGHLSTIGNASVMSDNLVLVASNLTGPIATFYWGSAQQAPFAIDDGLMCLPSLIDRRNSPVLGSGSSYPIPPQARLSQLAGFTMGGVGETRYYQCTYRNALASFCPPATSNRTNALAITWGM